MVTSITELGTRDRLREWLVRELSLIVRMVDIAGGLRAGLSVPIRSVNYMIETPVLDAMDAEAVLSMASVAHRQTVESDALILRLAAQWADRYNADALQKHPVSTDNSGEVLPGMERSKQFGGEGTPRVLEFAPVEFGLQLEMSAGQTAAMMADVLDLRHRLPKLWSRRVRCRSPAGKPARSRTTPAIWILRTV